MPLDREDKKARAKLALEYYIKREDMPMPQPDGEEDHRLDPIIDRLAQGVVELAVRLSESAAWMRWSSEARPPEWAIPFLTPEEIAGKGPPRQERTAIPADEAAPAPAKKKTRRSKKSREGPWTQLPPLDADMVQFLVDHYNELPVMDPETGRPLGEIAPLPDAHTPPRP